MTLDVTLLKGVKIKTTAYFYSSTLADILIACHLDLLDK